MAINDNVYGDRSGIVVVMLFSIMHTITGVVRWIKINPLCRGHVRLYLYAERVTI